MANSKKGFSMSFKPKLPTSSRLRDERNSAAPALSSAIDEDHHSESAAPNRDYVVGFGEGKVVTKEARVERGPRVIPLPEKPWKKVVAISKKNPQKQESGTSKSDPNTTSSTADSAAAVRDAVERSPKTAKEEKSLDELAAEAIARESLEEANGKIPLGGARSGGVGQDSGSPRVIGMAGQPSGGGRVGLLQQNMIPGLAEIDGEDAKFKHDLNHRAEDISVKSSAYEETPISEFGAALLRGMGWQGPQGDGTGAGTDLIKDVQPRHYRLGLGAQPRPPEEIKKPRTKKPGEKESALNEERLKMWEQKAMASQRRADEIAVTDVVEIVRGRSAGGERQRAMVLKTQGVPGLNKISVRMEGTGEKVFVERSSVIRVSEDDLARQPFDVKEGSDRDHRGGESNGHKSSKRSRSRSCSSNLWVVKRRRANAFILSVFRALRTQTRGGRGGYASTYPTRVPPGESVLRVSIISTRRFNSDCTATVLFYGFVGQTTAGEGGLPMLQEEIEGKLEFVVKKDTKKSFDSGVG